MIDAYLEHFEILRRIAERGLAQAQYEENAYALETGAIDQWQHMLDEIERTRLAVKGRLNEVYDVNAGIVFTLRADIRDMQKQITNLEETLENMRESPST